MTEAAPTAPTKTTKKPKKPKKRPRDFSAERATAGDAILRIYFGRKSQHTGAASGLGTRDAVGLGDNRNGHVVSEMVPHTVGPIPGVLVKYAAKGAHAGEFFIPAHAISVIEFGR